MIKELVHFVRHGPAVARQRRRSDRVEFFDLYERRLDDAGKAQWRTALVADLEGDVLEIGAGTGLTFPHYGEAARVTATDPDPELLRRAAERAERAAAKIKLETASGEKLPFPDGSFDAVVLSSVLCSVRSVDETLVEIERVLRLGGQLRLLEHVRSDRAIPGLLMDLFNPVWRALNRQGCNMNRDPVAALQAAGFDIEAVDSFQIFAPGVPTAFLYRSIRARRP